MLWLLALLAASTSVRSQSTTAVCDADYSWATNSRGQTPCLIAAYLAGACTASGQFSVPALPNATAIYKAPEVDEVNACVCSTVVYSLLSACADCSDHTYLKWSTWSVNCATSYVGVFNRTIPSGTAVPGWAYLNVIPDDNYSATSAQALAASGVSESTAASGPTNTVVTTDSSPKKKSSNAGAIAGGVVGGLVFLALVGLAVFFLLRRKKRQEKEHQRRNGGHAYAIDPNDDAFSSAPPMSIADTSYTIATSPPPKLYDPEDPSTFPSSPMFTSDQSSMAPSSTFPGTTRQPGSVDHVVPGGQYTGAAEI